MLGSDGKPIVVVEAKSLDSSLSENERMQMLNYANVDGVPFAGLTDGNRWELYSVFDQKPLSERSILKSTVSQDPTSQLSLRFLLLWRANMKSGSPQPAPEPIVEITSTPNPMPEQKEQAPAKVNETKNPFGAQQVSSTKMPGPGEGWTSMEKFRVVEGTKRPASMRFENDDERPFSRWNRVIVEVAEYLVRRDILTSDKCPIAAGSRSKRRLISAEPRHPSGRGFSNSLELSNGLYVELGFSARDCVKMSKYLLEHFGQDPAQVWLKTG